MRSALCLVVEVVQAAVVVEVVEAVLEKVVEVLEAAVGVATDEQVVQVVVYFAVKAA